LNRNDQALRDAAQCLEHAAFMMEQLQEEWNEEAWALTPGWNKEHSRRNEVHEN
jgi:hypothetical protein